jgi:hypothetical protein
MFPTAFCDSPGWQQWLGELPAFGGRKAQGCDSFLGSSGCSGHPILNHPWLRPKLFCCQIVVDMVGLSL